MKGTRHVTTRSARLMQVIETTSLRGDGTERSPVREVRQYWSARAPHPELLAEQDPDYLRARGCACPAEAGQPCPLTDDQCSARATRVLNYARTPPDLGDYARNAHTSENHSDPPPPSTDNPLQAELFDLLKLMPDSQVDELLEYVSLLRKARALERRA